jgi:hypothetical protein
MLDTGYWMLGAGYWMLELEGLWYRVEGGRKKAKGET